MYSQQCGWDLCRHALVVSCITENAMQLGGIWNFNSANVKALGIDQTNLMSLTAKIIYFKDGRPNVRPHVNLLFKTLPL